jgi:microcystin-dependent protein
MHRIDGPGATVDNKFTEGNPALAIPATTVTADILNALQEEICRVIEVGGGLTLNKANNTQLQAAINAMIAANLTQPWQTGDVKLTIQNAAPSGWILCNDGTIGDATSGGTTRANADCQTLFTLLWNNVSDTYAPVTGGRGASAAADWAAHKKIALTKMLGRALAVSGSGSGLTARTLGQTLGEEAHALTAAENGPHTHQIYKRALANTGGNVVDVPFSVWPDATAYASDSSGSGTAHNNMQPTGFLTAMIKL